MKTANLNYLGLGGVFALFHNALVSQSLATNRRQPGKQRMGSRQPGDWQPAGSKLSKRFSEGFKCRGY
jgi:hypothetical protein